MNLFCTKDCKYKEICKLSESDTPKCLIDVPPDGTIFGYRFEEIERLQRGNR